MTGDRGRAVVKRVAFIGLGIMGLPMAVNLVNAGFAVTGFSRRPESVRAFTAVGGRGAGSVGEAVAGADAVALMLPDGPDVEQVLGGSDGAFAHAAPGTLVIDFSSISPAVSRSLAAQAAGRGLRMLDAPVSGGEAAAVEGRLSVMVGGPAEDMADAAALLAAVGTTVKRVGPHGCGQIVKAANQLIVAGTIELVAEAIVLLERLDVDLDAALAVLAGGLAGNRVLDRKADAMRRREFKPGFRAALHHKDLGIVTAAAREAGVPLPLGASVAQLMGSLVAQGHGGLDHTALLLLEDQLAGNSEGTTSMSSTSNLAAVKRAYEALAAGRPDDVLAECADDIQWITPGRGKRSGTATGKEAAGQVLTELGAGGYQASPRHFLADDDRVVALVQATIAGNQHGAVDVWTFRYGRIGKYQHASTDTTLLDDLFGQD